MIRLHRPGPAIALDDRTRKYLAGKASAATACPPGDPKIAAMWAAFLGTKARAAVESALDKYTWKKCAYCEQVAAKDIEHFQPKSTYPGRMFSWDNFLRGCKNCNNAKLAHFPVDAAGRPLLLDPCGDDPLNYFTWNTITGATGVTPNPALNPRATATRNLFDLDQEPLREERRIKVEDVLYLLAHVVKETPVADKTKARLHDHLQPHRPWLGPIRELIKRPEPKYEPLVTAALAKLPQIRTWCSDWL